MQSAVLMGRHIHDTRGETKVHVWTRDGRFLARGSFEGHRFGETLGNNVELAEANLRDLLHRLDIGSFERASEARSHIFVSQRPGNLTVREVVNRFLESVRRRRGARTVRDYTARLLPLIEFAESPQATRRWRWAHQLDEHFAEAFRNSLQARLVTRNGRPGAAPRRISLHHLQNVLACCGTLVNWARDPRHGVLPTAMTNPFGCDFVGPLPRRDPLAPAVLPMSTRMALVPVMDPWELSTLALSLVLPCRPDELTGLLVSDVDRERRLLAFGSHAGGEDPTKGRTVFHVPYPAELDPLLDELIAGRGDGPLLRRRSVWAQAPAIEPPSQARTVAMAYQMELARRGAAIQTVSDRKGAFRAALRTLGGLNADDLAKPFCRLWREIRPDRKVRFYDLRGSISTEMKNAGVDYSVRRYVTGHAVGRDIMEVYESQDALPQHMQKYFAAIAPLLDAIRNRLARTELLGVPG
jgi:integrase